jgi:hypothetical protein
MNKERRWLFARVLSMLSLVSERVMGSMHSVGAATVCD